MPNPTNNTAPRDMRAAILAASTRLFAGGGFDGTSLQEIADEVGIRKPSLLHHFASKDQLRRAVLEGIMAHWNETLPRLLLAATATGRFDAVMGETVRFFLADPDRARLLVREVLDRPEEAKVLLEARVRPWLGAVADHIARGQVSGTHFPDVDPEAYVLHVLRLVIFSVATGDTFGPALGNGDLGADPERQNRELMRMARVSLFSPPDPAAPQTKARTKARRE